MTYAALIGDWLVSAARDILYNVVIAFLLVALGVCLGFIVRGITMAVLRAVKLDDFIRKLHLGGLFGKLRLSEVFADIFEIAIVIAFTVQALQVLGWQLIAGALSRVLYWIPNAIAGFVIFVIVYAVGKYIESRMQESESDVMHRFSSIVLLAVAFFGAILGLDQLGFNTSLLRQAVLIIIFGFALAFALAVGIAAGFGMRDEASDLMRKLVGTKPVRSSRARSARASSSARVSSKRKSSSRKRRR